MLQAKHFFQWIMGRIGVDSWFLCTNESCGDSSANTDF
jgi:hypothetical protein